MIVLKTATWADQKLLTNSEDQIAGIKATQSGGPTVYTVPGDYGGTGGKSEEPKMALDGNIKTKYFNRAVDGMNPPGINSGLVIKPRVGATVVTEIQFSTANDMPMRDPIMITLEGSNDPKAFDEKSKEFKLIYRGPAGLDKTTDRQKDGELIKFENKNSYTTYRILVTSAREEKDAVQFSEVRLYGTEGASPSSELLK